MKKILFFIFSFFFVLSCFPQIYVDGALLDTLVQRNYIRVRLVNRQAVVPYVRDSVIHGGYITDERGKRIVFPAIGYLISLFDQNGWKLVQYSHEFYYHTFSNDLFRHEYEYAIFYKKLTDSTQLFTFIPNHPKPEKKKHPNRSRVIKIILGTAGVIYTSLIIFFIISS